MQLRKQNGFFLLLLLGVAALIVVAVILFVQPANADPGVLQATDLSWNVVANGGETMSSASYQIMGTVGQAAAGPISGSSQSLLAGYWQDLGEIVYQIFLPIIRGN